MNIRSFERNLVVYSRFLTLVAVFGSLFGSLLMMFFGIANIYEAFSYGIWGGQEENVSREVASIISIVEGLDRFLIAIVLIYFAYGVYSLFVHPEWQKDTQGLPEWLRVKQIGQLKQVVAEVIIVILVVLFLRLALTIFQGPTFIDLTWQNAATFLLLPLATTLLSLSLRLVELHPKPRRGDTGGVERESGPSADFDAEASKRIAEDSDPL